MCSKWLHSKMDVGDSVSEENVRFSVLLGVALRKNDVDEFIKVYDTTLPKELHEGQIEHIKEEARKIADLPEPDYKKLVSSSQDQRPATMTDQGLGKTVYPGNDFKYIDDDDDIVGSTGGGNGGTKVPSLDIGSISRHSRHLNNTSNHVLVKNDLASLKSPTCRKDEKEEHNDSGLCCTSKTTSESTSDTDPNGSDTENGSRPGMFHYFTKPFDNKKKYGSLEPSSNSSVLYHNDANFDEAYIASDSDVASPVESPRDNSSIQGLGLDQATELKTIRIHKPETIGPVDREEDNDSNDDLRSVNLHERLYSHTGRSSSTYVNMEVEEDEEYMQEMNPKLNAKTKPNSQPISQDPEPQPGCSYWSSQAYPINSTDNNRTYGTYSTSSRSSSSSKSSLSGDLPRNGPKTINSKPPFGSPVDISKVGRSVGELIGAKSKDGPHMPASAPISEDRSSEESTKQTEGTKKKKKKKKPTKDDVTPSTSKDGDSYDENGNPVETHHSSVKKTFSNRITSGELSLRSFTDFSNSQFPGQMEDLSKLTNGQFVHDDRSESARRRAAKLKKRQADKTIKAEEIPGYRGKNTVEDLVEFIENTGTAKKKKKAMSTTTQPTNVFVVDLRKKQVVREKDKKPKLLNPSLLKSGEEMSSPDNISDKEEEVGVKKGSRENVKKEPRRLSDLSTKKIQLSHHSLGGARNLDKYDLCLPPDIETFPPKEAEFQLVTKSKKKKRPIGSFAPREVNIHAPREGHWRPVRSVTPPPTSSSKTDTLSTPPKAEKPAERAFSPSAFPVLSHDDCECDFPKSRGRRNSTGNAPSESVADDSSDMGWVKTTPSAEDTDVDSNSPLSPGGLKISYAEIAASPRPKSGAPGMISSTPVVAERRHSIGSMDDAIQCNKEMSSVTKKNDVKSQSQELLSNTIDDDSRAKARRNLDSAFQSNSTTTCAIQPVPAPSKASADNVEPIVTLPETSQSSIVKIEKPAQVTSKPPPPNAGHMGQPRVGKKSKAKCVIFLDKRIGDTPKNLGITFGFDENEAGSQGMSDTNFIDFNMDSNAPNICSTSTDITSISFKSEPLEQIDGHKLIMPVNGLVLPAQGLRMDQNQQCTLAYQSNQNRHPSATISNTCTTPMSAVEAKMWDDLHHHQSTLNDACNSKFNLEDSVRYLVREWEKVMDAKSKGRVMEYSSTDCDLAMSIEAQN